jgi:hypothetical protein
MNVCESPKSPSLVRREWIEDSGNTLKEGGRGVMPDEKYVEIRERKKRIEQVKRGLKDYATQIQAHTGKMREGAETKYYRLITDCVRQLWGPGWFFEEKIGLPEAERRIRQVVRPTLTTALGGSVHRLWFMYGEAIKKIDNDVKKWFGEQTAGAALRAQCLYELYEICEYGHPDAYGLAGLPALKKSCYSIYLDVSLVHLYTAQIQKETMLTSMWGAQAAREAFEAAVAGQVAAPGKSAAVAAIDGLLDAVLSDVDELVNVLEQARSAPAVARESLTCKLDALKSLA